MAVRPAECNSISGISQRNEGNGKSIPKKSTFPGESNVQAASKVKGRKSVVVQENPETNEVLSWRNVPKGGRREGNRRGRKVGLFGDSMVKPIHGRVLSQDVDNGFVIVRHYDGSRAQQVGKHMELELQAATDDFDTIIVHAGTNNLAPRRRPGGSKEEQAVEDIAEDVINAAKIGKEYGVEDICVSLITDRCRFRSKAKEVNAILRHRCTEENIRVIEHENISLEHLRDGTHLDYEFTSLFAGNFSNFLNSFL